MLGSAISKVLLGVIGALSVAVVVLWMNGNRLADNARNLQLEVDAMQQAKLAAEHIAEQARTAQAVAEAFATNFSRRARLYDEMRENFLRSDCDEKDGICLINLARGLFAETDSN